MRKCSLTNSVRLTQLSSSRSHCSPDTSCGALRSELDANAERGRERRELSVFSRRIGEYSTVKRHTAVVSTGTTGTSSPVAIEESTLPRPPDFPPYGLRMCFQLVSSEGGSMSPGSLMFPAWCRGDVLWRI